MMFQRRVIEIKSESTFEFQTIQVPKGAKINAVRSMLVEKAEIGSWILDRVRIYPNGKHLITLRRRVIKPELSIINA